eukprot:maker-scaffold419_size176504-snap-gene-0.29 protein:Tk02009 transcript:maker-scaffold419_size176504-snap-gene-0.29-mRNA-1 annotation:"amidase"
MMAVRYHRCTCHLRYSNGTAAGTVGVNNGHAQAGQGHDSGKDKEDDDEAASEEIKPQPWYFHVVASVILVVHGFTFLVPQSSDAEDTDMVRTIARWLGYDIEWVKQFTPYAQGLASVFNISLGIVSWWTSKESERYNRLIQLRVFAFCLNILHAYITGPVIYQNDDLPLMAPGRIISLFRLSYLTPGLMAAGVTEVIVEKEQESSKKDKEGAEDSQEKSAKKSDQSPKPPKKDKK